MSDAETIEINIDDVIFEPSKYPRRKWDSMTVTMLRNAIDNIPPIQINKNRILIDGLHRLQAHKLEGKTTIKAIVRDTKDQDILWEATRLNATHGKQLTLEEKEELSKRFFKEKNLTEAEIANALSVSIGKISEWVSNIRKERNEDRNQKILELYLRCWTEERIAEEVGLKKSQVDNVISSFFTDENNGNPPDSLQVFNLWEFPAPDNPPDPEFPGLMPGQVIENLLWYYTKPFDLVIDPMAGSGTTLDVCLKMTRRCLCFDINPTRPQEITKHDITMGFPKIPILRRDGKVIKPSLIILDPPYWRQRQDSYTKEPTNLANLKLDDFHSAIASIINSSKEILVPGGTIAFIISSTRLNGNVIDHFPLILKQINLPIIERIIVSYTTQQAKGYHITQAQQGHYMLRLYRDLVIFGHSNRKEV